MVGLSGTALTQVRSKAASVGGLFHFQTSPECRLSRRCRKFIPISVRKATPVIADARNRSPDSMGRLLAQPPLTLKKVSVPRDRSKHVARLRAAAGKTVLRRWYSM